LQPVHVVQRLQHVGNIVVQHVANNIVVIGGYMFTLS